MFEEQEINVVLNENSVEIKSCINRESKSNELTIKLYSCHNINMKILVVVTPPSIYHHRCYPRLFGMLIPQLNNISLIHRFEGGVSSQ